MPDRPLTLKQEIFCRKYLECEGNAAEAFRQSYPVAKWSPNAIYVQCCRLMQRPNIRLRINNLTQEAARAASVTPERIIAEYARLAFQDSRKVFDDQGNLKPIHELDDDTAAAIAGIEQEEIYSGNGEAREQIGRLKKIKLSDKRAALADLAKCMGMFIDRSEVSGPGGGPIEIEIAARLAAGRARLAKREEVPAEG
jgi:phage terminase small subunit